MSSNQSPIPASRSGPLRPELRTPVPGQGSPCLHLTLTLHLSCLSRPFYPRPLYPMPGPTVSSPAPAPLLFVLAPSQAPALPPNGGGLQSCPRSAALCTYESAKAAGCPHRVGQFREMGDNVEPRSDPWQGARHTNIQPTVRLWEQQSRPRQQEIKLTLLQRSEDLQQEFACLHPSVLKWGRFPVLMAIFLLTCWTTCKGQLIK